MTELTIRDMFPRLRAIPLEHEVGIEIEVEGEGFVNVPVHWRLTQDGSLRGGCEYVLSKPIHRDKVLKVVEYLNTKLKSAGALIRDSDRTSVHVHINIQGMTRTEVINFTLLYLIFEDLLIDICGDERKGNNYCLTSSEAEYTLYLLKQLAGEKNWGAYVDGNDRIRYAACNLAAIGKYGSLEFRGMRGTMDSVLIDYWVKVLLKLKDAASKFDTPWDILAIQSGQGAEDFTRMVFDELSDSLPGTPFDWRNAVQEGVWRVQGIAQAFKRFDKPKVITFDKQKVIGDEYHEIEELLEAAQDMGYLDDEAEEEEE